MKPILFAAAVVFSTVAMGNVPATWLQDSSSSADRAPETQPEDAAPPQATTGRAAHGVVEAVRRIEHGGNQAATFEVTVRMRDGSTRISNIASAAKWRDGDRIMLIGGAPAPATSQH